MEQPSLADTLLRNIGSKQDQYCEDLRTNHALLKTAAQRVLALPTVLFSTGVEPSEECQVVLEEQKQVIRSIAQENVEREQFVETFCRAIASIRDRMGGGDGDDTVFSSSNENALLPVDYQKAIDDMMAFHTSSQAAGELLYNDNDLYCEILDALGDPKPTVSEKKKKTPSKRHRGGNSKDDDDDDDDDDDIEVMRNVETQASGTAATTVALKCPISRALMTDAVQNTVCHHIYSRAGITGYLQQSGYRGRSVRCPVVGCTNRAVTLSQLTDHYETSRLAQKQVRLQSQRKALQDEAAGALMDTDDDDEQ
jgi:hypothetical protein